MNGVEAAIAEKDFDRTRVLVRPLARRHYSFGSASEVEGIEAWFDVGIKTPIVVPSSASGGQIQAFEILRALGLMASYSQIFCATATP